jgi:chalcone isomerase-like protein
MPKITRRACLILAAVASLAVPPSAFAAECQKIQFPDTVNAAGTDLVLNGLGIRKATILAVKVYVAGLYLPQKSADPEQILRSNRPWQLTLRFVRDVDASDMHSAFKEGFENALGQKAATLKPQIDAMNAQIVEIKKGQYLTFTNDPAKGVTVDMNGAAGSPIQGPDFAMALLSVWLGPKPPNADLKTGLLGGKCE